MRAILSFGEILFDIIENKDYLGGAPLNFASHMSRLGNQSYILSRIGNDRRGAKALGKFNQIGVETKFIQRDSFHPTGLVQVELKEGIPQFRIEENAAYDFIEIEEFALNYTVEKFSLLYFGTLAQRNEISRSTLQKIIHKIDFPYIFFDVNLRQKFYTPDIIYAGLDLCNVLKLNDDEAEELGRMLFHKTLDPNKFAPLVSREFGLDIVIITSGAKGCFTYSNGKIHFVEASPVNVVDTVGAGDAFSASFIHSILNGEDTREAAHKANLLGGYVASCRGPIPPYSNKIKKLVTLKSSVK